MNFDLKIFSIEIVEQISWFIVNLDCVQEFLVKWHNEISSITGEKISWFYNWYENWAILFWSLILWSLGTFLITKHFWNLFLKFDILISVHFSNRWIVAKCWNNVESFLSYRELSIHWIHLRVEYKCVSHPLKQTHFIPLHWHWFSEACYCCCCSYHC